MDRTVMDAPPFVPRKLTYEEFLARCDERNAAEWVNGEINYMTVSAKHDDVNGFLSAVIRAWVEEHNAGRILQEPFQMKTGPELPGRAPDICFLANDNLGRLRTNHIEGPADLVIEIVSPESIGRDRGDKFQEYEQGGVREYWVIDPIRRQADFYLRGEDGYYHAAATGGDGIYRSAVIEGLWLQVAWLWSDPLPSLVSVLKEWRLV
jgi:Uma2 family endonuclease